MSRGRALRALSGALAAAASVTACAGALTASAAGAVAPTQAADYAAGQQAVLRAADLPGTFTVADPSSTVFLDASTGTAACDASAQGLTISAVADAPTYVRGPLIVASHIAFFATKNQAGEALVREVRTTNATCVALRVSRVGLTLKLLEIQDVPSLGSGAVRVRARLVLPSQPRRPLYADAVYALRGRALVRLRVLSVGTPPAVAAGNSLAATMARRLPSA